jgi:hypothetical protein
MEKWEYCGISHLSDHTPLMTYFGPSGVDEQLLELDSAEEHENYKLWKRRGGRTSTTKERYLLHKAVALLLSDGWELYQIVSPYLTGSLMFRRRFSEHQGEANADPLERWRAEFATNICPKCRYRCTPGATRCGNCGALVGPQAYSESREQPTHDS